MYCVLCVHCLTSFPSFFQVFIIETWQPPPTGYGSQRFITVYSNAPTIQLELNGKVVGTQTVPGFGQDDYGQCSFNLTYAAGNLTAVRQLQHRNHSGLLRAYSSAQPPPPRGKRYLAPLLIGC